MVDQAARRDDGAAVKSADHVLLVMLSRGDSAAPNDMHCDARSSREVEHLGRHIAVASLSTYAMRSRLYSACRRSLTH